jgi:hypothetical protein
VQHGDSGDKDSDMVEAAIDETGRVFVEGEEKPQLQLDLSAPRAKPRDHHFKFAKLWLPKMALSDPPRFFQHLPLKTVVTISLRSGTVLECNFPKRTACQQMVFHWRSTPKRTTGQS